VNLPAIVLMQKFWRLPRCDQLLLLEATLSLAIAGFAIAVLPFRHVGRLAAHPIRRSQPSQQTCLTEMRRIRWAIIACAPRVPWHAMCFQRGLAAQFMLRRRGVPSVLYYGAAPDEQTGLSAHVWVRASGVDVIGSEIASRFAVLMTFPPEGESS
jgi:hypothetical protein